MSGKKLGPVTKFLYSCMMGENIIHSVCVCFINLSLHDNYNYGIVHGEEIIVLSSVKVRARSSDKVFQMIVAHCGG